MTDTYTIGQPYPLFSLPRSRGNVESGIRTGQSCTVQGSKKRKRTEIVIAADGDSVGLYSLKHPRLVTSFPVPPDLQFTASPICCRVNSRDPKRAARLLYAAARRNVGQTKHEFLYFHEDLTRSFSSSTTTEYQQRKNVTTLGSDDDPLVFQDVVPSNDLTTDDSIAVITIQKKGKVTCFGQELDREHWRNNLFDTIGHAGQHDDSPSFVVEDAFMLNSEAACREFLHNRPDIMGVLGHNSDQESSDFISLLFSITHDTTPETGYRFSIFAIRPHSSVPNQQSALQLLSTCTLPMTATPESTTSSRIAFRFDSSSGCLQQLISNSIVTYTFEDVNPKVSSRLNPPGEQLSTFIPLNHAAVLANTTSSISIYDIRYHSVQAVQSSFLVGQSHKRKPNQQGPRGDSLQLVSYHSDIGLAVGLSGEHLIALEIRGSDLNVTRNAQSSRLVDSFGKACGNKSSFNFLETSKEDARWAHAEGELNHLVNVNNVSRFEERFAQVIGLEDWTKSSTTSKPAKVRDLEASGQKSTGMSQSIHAKSLYALSKIFALNTNRSRPMALTERPSALCIKFLPPKVLKWLNTEGYLTPNAIDQALRLKNTATQSPGTIKYVDMVNAIANADHGLMLLSDILMDAPYIPLHAVLNCLSVLLQSFSGPPETPTLDNRLLTNGDPAAGQPTSKGDTETSRDLELLAAEEVVMQDIDLVNNILESGPLQRQAALAHCLEKLSTGYNAGELARSMRNHLPRQEIVLLVQFLRHELGKGGWSNAYLDVYPVNDPEELESPDEGTLPAICTLLNGALDALGTAGWLAEQNLSNQHSNSTEVAIIDNTEADTINEELDLLALLRDETSSVLEGVQESAFFQHFLKDFLRFEDAFKDALPETSNPSSGGKRKRQRSDALAVVSNPAIRDLSTATTSRSGMLPMGSTTVQKIDRKNVGPGGEVKMKSARHIGGIKSRRVGEYSFETLEV